MPRLFQGRRFSAALQEPRMAVPKTTRRRFSRAYFTHALGQSVGPGAIGLRAGNRLQARAGCRVRRLVGADRTYV